MATDIELSTRRIWNQNEVECCTSCAISACLEALHRDYEALSPIFHYRSSGARFDRGLSPVVALGLARSVGICLYSLHPHGLSRTGLRARPSSRATRDATDRRLRHVNRRLYRRFDTRPRALQMRSVLGRGHPMLLVIWPDSGYRKLADGDDQWRPTQVGRRDLLHAVAVIGYRPDEDRFIVQDSRGSDFARGGQWFLAGSDCDTRSIHEVWEIKDR